MKSFEDYNPIALFLYFLTVTLPAMFCMDPLLLALSLAGAFALHLSLTGLHRIREVLWVFLLPLIGLLANSIFSHNGATVLFLVNDIPITREAGLYGLTLGLMLAAILLWFRSFSRIMTSDKLLYIFAAASPKLALILSMTLRYIPLYKRQTRKIDQAQIALGLYRDDSLIDRIRGRLRVFSVMVTWALENGVVTADSMTARGYGVGRRTHYALYRWRREDILFTLIILLLGAAAVLGIGCHALGIEFYPVIRRPMPSPLRLPAYLGYGLLAVIPAILNGKEALLWRSLQSET